MQFADDFDDAELLAAMDAPIVNASTSITFVPKLATAQAPTCTKNTPVANTLASALTTTLATYFGHDTFRSGQLEVIAAAVSGRDTCVYWSTGSGKSLCYQLPALHTGKTSLVISPLVSLMEDQVAHMNNTAGSFVGGGGGGGENGGAAFKPLAAFLGSAQTDPLVEEKALRGEYAVLYVTPEKLVGVRSEDDGPYNVNNTNSTPTYFVSRLKEMVACGKIGLIAVDEAHCLSQWGHDFRTSYRALHQLRTFLSPNGEVPLMALTATAVDTVRLDISQTLTLKNPLVATNSVDRPNLKITACKKRGKESDLSLIAERVKATSGSTIVYVPTIRETEEVSEALRQKFKVNRTTNRSGEPKQMLTVGTYHGSLPHIQRKQTHHDFLTGVCRVVVATTAFGMGIDKHDIRLVVHYGSPKTMEEYYQQIGRAGRDGVLSLCLMLYGESDFVKYQSDFYVGKLSAEAKLTQKKSTDALERFSRDPTACRRAGILQHFGEKEPGVWKTSPEDGKKVCGTCDNCVRVFSADEGGKTLRREFTLEAVPVLLAIGKGFGGGGVSMSHVVALATDSAPPANGRLPANGVRETIRVVRTMLDPVTRSSVFAKEITMSLVSHGFLKKATVKGGYSSFEVFHVTPIGAAVANAAFCVFSDANFGSLDAKDLRATAEQAMTQHLPTKESRVFLPIPEAVQRAETECKVAADAKIDELKKSGVDVSSIPQQELDAGVGPALNAELQWARNLRTHRNAGRDEKATALQTLLQRIETWRDATADLLNIAPTAVFPSHVAKRVAYACASSAGMPLDVESLRSAGVRVVGAAGLVLVIQQALSELGLGRPLGVSDADDVASDGQQKCTYMKHGVLTPTTPWLFALYKPRKKKGVPDQPPTWEVSYDRFVKKNESPSAIAMTQDTGRAVQVGTVVGHLLEALVQGKPVDMRRVVQSVGSDFFPSRVEWRSLETACGNASQNPVGDPALFSQKEILRDGLILGPETVDKDRETKTEEEKEKERVWYDKIRAFVALKRSGIEPEWEHGDERDAKRVKI